MLSKLLAAALLSTAASPALAEDWVWVTTSQGRGAALLIDTDSIAKRDGNIVAVRVLTVLAKGDPGFDALISDALVDCSANKMRIGRTSSHDVAGKMLGVDEDSPAFEWDPIVPNSNYELVKQAVCGEIAMPDARYGAGFPIIEVRAQLAGNGS